MDSYEYMVAVAELDRLNTQQTTTH
jgi:hypothetical protein